MLVLRFHGFLCHLVMFVFDFVSLIPNHPCLYWDSMDFVSSCDVCFKETLYLLILVCVLWFLMCCSVFCVENRVCVFTVSIFCVENRVCVFTVFFFQ